MYTTKSKDEYVFPVERRHGDVVFWTVDRIRKMTGIKDFSFHSLRHTVSTYIAGSSDLALAKEVLGHTDVKTNMGYTHPRLKEREKLVEIMAYYFLGDSSK